MSETLVYTARREYGTNPRGSAYLPFTGQWVVRDQHGTYYRHSRYRNDLLAFYPGLIIEED